MRALLHERLPSAAVLALVVLGAGFWGRAASAQGANPALAEALFQEGRQLMDAGSYAEACRKFAESQRLDPGLGTLLNLATCHERYGRIASAWAELTEALGIARREKRKDVQKFATDHLAALQTKLSRATISVPKENDLPDLALTLDGRELGRPAWGTAAPIDPGEHALVATAPGRKTWAWSFSIGQTAEQKRVEVPALEETPPEPAARPAPGPPQDEGPPTAAPPAKGLAQAAATPPAEERAASPPPEAPQVPPHALRYVGFVLVGLGGLTGSVTGLMALSKGRGTVLPSCNEAARTCPAAVRDDLSTTRTLATVSTVAFLAAGVGAGLFAADFFVKPSSGLSRRGGGVWASVGPTAASFGGDF
jgi:hypothetical protein